MRLKHFVHASCHSYNEQVFQKRGIDTDNLAQKITYPSEDRGREEVHPDVVPPLPIHLDTFSLLLSQFLQQRNLTVRD